MTTLKDLYKAGARLYRNGNNRGDLRRWITINELPRAKADAARAGFEDECRVNPDSFIALIRNASLGDRKSRYTR